MQLLEEIRCRLRQIAPQALAAAAVAYFAFHAIQGERGLLAYKRLTDELQETQLVAGEVAKQRARWEHKVSLLRPEGIDPDMLEERARVLLNYLREDEMMIYLPKKED